MDTVRILAIIHSRRASEFSSSLECFVETRLSKKDRQIVARREASIWNIVTCIAKGKHEQAPLHAPLELREQYVRLARKRYDSLRAWAGRHPVQAASLCAPLIAEYDRRAKQRALLVSA
jgi:hypothetical protein